LVNSANSGGIRPVLTRAGLEMLYVALLILRRE